MATINSLITGFQRFKDQYFGDDSRLYAGFKDGQPAKTLMISCCDSRVDPAILTDCSPGDLFTIRNVANLVPPYEADGHYHGTSAALEYAVNALKVENIIVMGHASCGGIKALWEHEDEVDAGTEFIHPWVSIADEARAKIKAEMADTTEAEQLRGCEQAAILVSLENLLSFDCVRQQIEAGELTIHGWYFDMHVGELLSYKPKEKAFSPVKI